MNGWTAEIIDTVAHWQHVCTKLSLVYDQYADYYRRIMARCQVIQLIISLAGLVSSTLDLSESSLEYRIILLVTTVLTGLVTGLITIKGYTALLEKYSTYNERLVHFLGLTAAETSVPIAMRANGIEFVQKNKDHYQKLLLDKPNILGKDLQLIDLTASTSDAAIAAAAIGTPVPPNSLLHRRLPDFYCPSHLSQVIDMEF